MFQIGEKVHIKTIEQLKNKEIVYDEILEFANQDTEIIGIDIAGYLVSADNGSWHWAEDWLELQPSEKKYKKLKGLYEK
mgnify:FL=1